LEPLWQTADSVCRFVQQWPISGQPASEATTVYLLYDQQNLYVAFRCFVQDFRTVFDKLNTSCDGVRLLVDTFDDNTTCYCFAVDFSGRESDYRVIDNGLGVEEWNGVWWSAAQKHDWGYGIEMAIPFKTLRYPAGQKKWGVDFGRYLVGRNERDFWANQPPTGYRVENQGRLLDIEPGMAGLHLEVYPVGLVRQEKQGSDIIGWDDHATGAVGLDLAWLPTTTANLQLTGLPDFAQIEADPTQVNLTKYELWQAERRPFFMEAAETFATTTQPIKLFYSRRIGRPLPDRTVVPVLGGVKYTDRFCRLSVGALAALTGSANYRTDKAQNQVEPTSLFSVLALRRQFFTNSELGFLFAGKDNKSFSNHGMMADLALRHGSWAGKTFLAGSQFGDSLDYAGCISLDYVGTAASGSIAFQHIGPQFNMNGPGFTTFRGQTVSISLGPDWYSRGAFRTAQLKLNTRFSRDRDYWDKGYDKDIGLWVLGSGRSRWSASGSANIVSYYEMGQRYQALNLGAYASSDYSRPLATYGWLSYTTKSYNYHRHRFAPWADAALAISARLGEHTNLQLENEAVLEFQAKTIDFPQDVTWLFRPELTYTFTPKMTVTLRAEIVRCFPAGTYRSENTCRLSYLYTWTFLPRSTFYFAGNWDNSGPDHTTVVIVAKVRYLFVF